MPRTKEQIKKYNKEYYQQKKEARYIDMIYKKHTKKESELILSDLCDFYFDEFNKSYYDWFNSF